MSQRRVLHGSEQPVGRLQGDFTVTPRVLLLSLLAIAIGLLSTGVAFVLLRLISLFTNLFYFHRWSTQLASPAQNTLGGYAVLVPVVGALIIGLMARYGSERIRGHGIPEALESILINGSRVQPRLAILKPLSSAISIGSGGPFGAEGPIIMTGGAFGSMVAQLFHLSSAERKTLLVAGAAAGMSATFAAPLASVLLAVELLLFEWKPRSLIPVALASATAGAARRYVIGLGPLFPVPAHPVFIGPPGLAGCVLAGLLAGFLSALLTWAVYASEDAFQKLPIHWMWWPAIGGLVIGVGGLIFPQALGVGYDTIGALIQGDVPRGTIVGILLVKSIIWAVALGSGTSGGVLAPLLMMGGALGGLEGMFLPHEGAGFWPLISMGAILGGTMRSPFTGIVFALELTHDFNVLLPLLVANVLAYAVSVLLLKRSILTEKVSRRGYHLGREYSVDPLEILFAREVMRTYVAAFTTATKVEEAANHLRPDHSPRGQHLYPVLDSEGRLAGVITRKDLRTLAAEPRERGRLEISLAALQRLLTRTSSSRRRPDGSERIHAHARTRPSRGWETGRHALTRGSAPRSCPQSFGGARSGTGNSHSAPIQFGGDFWEGSLTDVSPSRQDLPQQYSVESQLRRHHHIVPGVIPTPNLLVSSPRSLPCECRRRRFRSH